MARPIEALELLPEEREELERRVRAATTSQRDCLRARIVLLRHQGLSQREVAQRVGVSVPCVNRWSQRFDAEGIAGLADQPGRGRRPSIPAAKVEQVLTQAGQQPAAGRAGAPAAWPARPGSRRPRSAASGAGTASSRTARKRSSSPRPGFRAQVLGM